MGRKSCQNSGTMKEELFVCKPCKTKAAFQANFENISFDMKNIEKILKKENYSIELSLNDLIIAKKEHTLNIFKNGKIMIKDVKSEKESKEIIKKIYKKIKN